VHKATRTPVVSSSPKEWYKHFFRGVALDFWNNAVNPLAKDEALYLKRQLHLRRGSKVLDVPCGNGRHALELAALGVQVTGVDFSAEQLNLARVAAKRKRLKIEFLQHDKRKLDWQSEFHGAYCCGNSFGYLDDFGMEQFVSGVSHALKIGGRFVIDTAMAAESIIPNLDENWWMKAGDVTVMIQNHYQAATSTLHITLNFLKNGRTTTREITHRVYTVAEIRNLLVRHQLAVTTLHADITGKPFELGEPQLWITAKKVF
jgi:cyclopropane fatty-acyl-phospholipid synthase-like methyltransferase